ncbi:MAG: hypothetical protein RBG13Loki_0663 [Promethearchaeota archaeon CR_4]|nr:MAG: hypothetical protein RBG13Loki_0663 [Candidatus Lokiarchaeota archaeon CR_4]
MVLVPSAGFAYVRGNRLRTRFYVTSLEKTSSHVGKTSFFGNRRRPARGADSTDPTPNRQKPPPGPLSRAKSQKYLYIRLTSHQVAKVNLVKEYPYQKNISRLNDYALQTKVDSIQ